MKAATILIALLLAACENSTFKEPQADQQLRREIFMECLDHAPAGPVATKYNDWAEVVDECGSQAYYQSLQVGPNPGKARASDPTTAGQEP